MSLATQLRAYFAPRPDPFAGGDLGNAQRLGGLFWTVLILLTVALWALSPPNDAIGAAGWIPAAAVAIGLGGAAFAMRRERLPSWDKLLAVAYLTVVGIAVMQWLAGGTSAPYERLLLLPMGLVAAIQPPRRIAVFMGFLLLSLAAPFFYDGWNAHAANASGATFVIWCGLAMGVNVLMSGVRAQRLAQAEAASEAREEATEAREKASEAWEEATEAREEARVDALTALPNRRAFNETLGSEVERARRLEFPLCMAMVDIVNFKEINDRWSYAEGDRALRAVSTAMRSALREPDLCFRWGGDEFALILGGATAEEATELGDRLVNEVGAACRRPDTEPIKLRFAVAQLWEGMPAEELVELAGIALTSSRAGSSR
jgi:diguanylate cyclase (GGDEF)-like protein